MNATHAMSDDFMKALGKGGCLCPILDAVRADDTLMLGLRGGYVSIYYRGGELLKIEPGASGGYRIKANRDYGHAENHLNRAVATAEQAKEVVDSLPPMKWNMDRHSKIRSSHEREFQQLVVRENNRSRSAGSSDYFITDMEHAHEDARFDMLGGRWMHNDRKHRDRLTPVIFEMKYGESALSGSAGIEAHFDDLRGRLSKKEFVDKLKANVASQFNQLNALELIDFNGSESQRRQFIESGMNGVQGSNSREPFRCGGRLRVVLVLAALNPRSSKLLPILERVYRQWKKDPIEGVDVRVFCASFCGYVMHERSMLDLPEAISRIWSWRSG